MCVLSGTTWPGVRHAGELPPLAGDHLAVHVAAGADGEHVVRVVDVGRRIGDVVAVGHVQHVGCLVHHPVAADEAGDRRAVEVPGARDAEAEAARAVARDVPLPADPDDGEALPHEERIAPSGRIVRIETRRGRAVEVARREFPPSVAHLDDPDAAPPCGVHGLQHGEASRCLHESVGVARGAGQVHDPVVHRIGRVDPERDPAPQHLVRAVVAERSAVEHDGLRVDRHTEDAGVGRQGKEDGSEQHAAWGKELEERARKAVGHRPAGGRGERAHRTKYEGAPLPASGRARSASGPSRTGPNRKRRNRRGGAGCGAAAIRS